MLASPPIKRANTGATKMAQLVKALVPEPDDLSLILRSHVVAKADSSDLHTSAIDTHACTHTHAHTNIL